MFFLAVGLTLPGQQHKIKGKVVDGKTGLDLSYANLRIKNTSMGTSSNIDGKFEFLLQAGNYEIIASFIGYKSDTVSVNLNNDKNILLELYPVSLDLPEVTVVPGVNPAIEIIRKTIAAKKKREERLDSYIFKAYTKGNIKTTEDISASSSNIGLSLGSSDSSELKITGILESESIGYYKKPDLYKEEIVARKQSSNIPPTINTLTGGRVIQNFYEDDLQFFNRPIPSPISESALDYYYYYLEDSLAQDDLKIYQIFFAAEDNSDPAFIGRIYIADSLYTLVQVDIGLNDAANPAGIFEKINVFQQFLPYDDNIYMPIDYRVSVEGDFIGLFKFGFELHSIFYDYDINTEISDDVFGMALVKVMPDADKKDSLYWSSIQAIPNTDEEISAYKRIDSLEAIPVGFWDRFSFLSTRIGLSDNFSVSGPLSLYKFNRVEGNVLNFGFYLDDEFDKRLNTSLELGYGFADKKWKGDWNISYLLGDYRTSSISFRLFDKITDLFGESIEYNELTSTLFNLISKYDFRDYYYTKGFQFNVTSEIFPILELGLGFKNRTDRTGFVNTDFSIINRDKVYRENKPINDVKINAFTANFKVDFRRYIEDGYFRRRLFRYSLIPVIRGEAIFSNKNILKSEMGFRHYRADLTGSFPTYKSAVLSYGIRGVYSEGAVPLQWLYALPGNIESAGKFFTFRTLRIGEVYGDKVVIFSIQHLFRDELFKLLSIPYLKSSQLLLSSHLNIAWNRISSETAAELTDPFITFERPFFELGFGIGHLLFPVSVEFTWKLNYRGKNNFVIGLNTFAL
jgi:hypothetical protein